MIDDNDHHPQSSHRESSSSGKLKSSRSDPIPPSDEDGSGFDSLEVVKAAWKRMQLRQDHEMVMGSTITAEQGVSPLSFMGKYSLFCVYVSSEQYTTPKGE